MELSKKGINRREFINTTLKGLSAAGLGYPMLRCTPKEKVSEPMIVYRTLGNTNLRIPAVSFGVMNSDSPDLLRRALDLGINHFDTAHVYLRGNSERFIGQVMEEAGMRDKVYIATKMRFNRDREKNVFLLEGAGQQPGATEENFNQQLEESLRRLRTDYVDILYIHSCYSPEMAAFEPLMKALIKTKEAGKARFIGISTHQSEPEVIRAAVDTGIYDVILTAYNYLMERREDIKEAIQYAAGSGLGVVAMKTQGGVRLNQEKTIEVNHKAALKWVLQDKNVCTTIPGITAIEQMELDFSVMRDLSLTEDERSDLKLAAQMRGTLFCQNCRTCIPSCSRRVDIPNLMRAFMYAEGYGNLVQAQMTVEELPENAGLQVCQDCSSCTAVCPNRIDIASRLRSLISYNFS